jgi:hypothetical protein
MSANDMIYKIKFIRYAGNACFDAMQLKPASL